MIFFGGEVKKEVRQGICNYLDALLSLFLLLYEISYFLAALTFSRASFALGKLKASFRMLLLLGCLTVAAHELVDATGGVDEIALTSIERVRGA